jgi:hypothetical protein
VTTTTEAVTSTTEEVTATTEAVTSTTEEVTTTEAVTSTTEEVTTTEATAPTTEASTSAQNTPAAGQRNFSNILSIHNKCTYTCPDNFFTSPKNRQITQTLILINNSMNILKFGLECHSDYVLYIFQSMF